MLAISTAGNIQVVLSSEETKGYVSPCNFDSPSCTPERGAEALTVQQSGIPTGCLGRYIIGEIMYGGHVVEDWDRRLTSAYLQTVFQEGLLEGQPIFPKFDFRPPTSNLNQRQAMPLSCAEPNLKQGPALQPRLPWPSKLTSKID